MLWCWVYATLDVFHCPYGITGYGSLYDLRKRDHVRIYTRLLGNELYNIVP
jgi:hypothetical protein